MTNGEAVNWIINISADIGKAEHRDLWHYEQALSEIREMLESQPERKTGKWLRSGSDIFPYECNQCEDTNERMTSWCPHCGAKMER